MGYLKRTKLPQIKKKVTYRCINRITPPVTFKEIHLPVIPQLITNITTTDTQSDLTMTNINQNHVIPTIEKHTSQAPKPAPTEAVITDDTAADHQVAIRQ